MCRIYGYLNRSVPPDGLRRLGSVMRHGGPDGRYHRSGQRWGIGAARLAVTDPQAGRQPYLLDGREDDLAAVFNGEIYNHEELRKSLESDGYRFRDRCDGSLIPALYDRYGPEFTAKLDGMYAIALVDLRGAPTLHLMTDDSGMKPLYYSTDRTGGICFASEPAAILELPGVGREMWAPGLDAYLTTRTPFGERTMFEDIRTLPPAATAVYSASTGLRIRRRPPPVLRTGPDAGLAGSGRELLGILRRATGRLAQADVPVAAVCSGGLDSSLITTLLSESVPDLTAFHIGYHGRWPMDEHRYAQLAAAHGGARLQHVELDPADIPALLPDVVAHLGQPNSDPIAVSTFALFRAVRGGGFKVALTGDAADEHFGGYDRIRQALTADADWIPGYLASLAAVPRGLREQLYSDDYRAYLDGVGHTEDDLATTLRATPGSRLDKITALEVGSRLPAYHLRRVDHLSMASAVEVRLPFCQPALTRFAGALPGAMRATPTEGKRALYAASAGVVPAAITARPKQPFTLPVAAMLGQGGPLHGYVREVLAADELRTGGLLDPHAVTALLDRHTTRPGNTTALAIWALTVFQLWHRQHAAGRYPASGPLPSSSEVV
ncbi:asparagine synthase (glutamine-hydrolyzing) [Streptomyces sp. NPDC058469]|uniref:asparagine synthase (glutamine-hydrolyzing) n=1 Tax=Streptomyces sp. NPDC058469 TaxID=3346514 RepID=UPI00364FBFDE